jgi:hypothetical protein
MTRRFIITAVLIMTAQGGCAGSPEFDRLAMREALTHDGTQADESTTAARGTPPMAPPTPLRLAYYFVEVDFPLHDGIWKAEWVGADKSLLADSLTPLKGKGIATDIFLLTDPTIRGLDVKKIRTTAARYGADAVLIVNGVGAVDRSNNAYAALYPTVIGAYVAPGTVGKSLFVIEGAVWDTRVDRLYTRQAAEGHARRAGPAMKLENREVLASAKHSALEALGKKIVDTLIDWKSERSLSDDQLR